MIVDYGDLPLHWTQTIQVPLLILLGVLVSLTLMVGTLSKATGRGKFPPVFYWLLGAAFAVPVTGMITSIVMLYGVEDIRAEHEPRMLIQAGYTNPLPQDDYWVATDADGDTVTLDIEPLRQDGLYAITEVAR